MLTWWIRKRVTGKPLICSGGGGRLVGPTRSTISSGSTTTDRLQVSSSRTGAKRGGCEPIVVPVHCLGASRRSPRHLAARSGGGGTCARRRRRLSGDRDDPVVHPEAKPGFVAFKFPPLGVGRPVPSRRHFRQQRVLGLEAPQLRESSATIATPHLPCKIQAARPRLRAVCVVSLSKRAMGLEPTTLSLGS